jgi:tetratricopeptide (TPR) repeat protein
MDTMSTMTARPVIASMLNNKGVILMEQQRFEAAKKSLSQALSLAEESSDEDGDENHSVETDRLSSPNEEYPENRSDIMTVHSELLKLLSPFNDILYDKAPKYRSEYDEGMDNFKDLFRLKISSRNLSGTILFNLARLAHNQDKFKEALNLYWQALVSLESFGIQDDPITIAILFCTGQIQYIYDDYAASLETYTTALSFATLVFGKDSLEVAACLNCIGILHYVYPNGDKNAGMRSLLTSLEKRQKLQGRDHVDIGTTLNNIGRFRFQAEKLDLALDAYTEALRIRRKHQDESADVAATLFK